MTTTPEKSPSLAPLPTRVDMHYTVHVNGATRRVELPFVLGVMADLVGQPEDPPGPVSDREFVPIDANTFDSHLAAIRPRVAFQIPNELTGHGSLGVDLSFDCLDDFAPVRVAQRVTELREMLERSRDSGTIAALDSQLNLILHHPSFQRLEATWGCLYRLVTQTETDDDVKIVVMNLSMPELLKTLRKFKGTAWDQSPIFKKIYDERYRAAGGEPLGCVVLDYYFDQSSNNVEALAELMKIGGAAHVPFVTGASPTLFQMDSWGELGNPRQLTKMFTTPEYAEWRSLRESEDSRYLVLTMPRFVVRPRYERQRSTADQYEFEEDIGSAYAVLWGNAGYLLSENVLRSFRIFGWPSRISGLQTGGAVEGLATVSVPRWTGPGHVPIVTDAMVTDRREAELVECGMMALVARGDSGLAEFPTAVTLNKPAQYDDPDATANAFMASRLSYVFGVSRMAHYLKAIIRDVSSELGDRASLEAWFKEWLADYVDPRPDSLPGATSPRPFAKGEITVEEVEGGYFSAKYFIRPNF